jgi:hypothetical protein
LVLDIATADPIGEVLGRAAARDYSMFSVIGEPVSENENASCGQQRVNDDC